MRPRPAIMVATLLALVLGTAESRAANIVDIVWISTTGSGTTGGSVIEADPGDRLTAEIRLSADVGGVVVYAISLEFDTDLKNELDLVKATEHLPQITSPGDLMEFNFSPGVESTQESTGAQEGNVLTYEAAVITNTPPALSTMVIGTVVFDVTANVAIDGADVFSGAFNNLIDGVGNGLGVLVTGSTTFNTASVDLTASSKVPSLSPPALAGLLLAIALTAVAAIRRRR